MLNGIITYKKLKDLCTFENGDRGENYPSASDFVDKGIPFVNGGLIDNGKVSLDGMNYITNEKFESLRAGKATFGDILWSIRGSFGKVALCPFERCAIASALVIVRPNNADSLYLYYMMNSPFFTKQCTNSDNGSVQANLSVDVAKEFLIPWMPDDYRKLFVDIMSIIDAKVSVNSGICLDLEAMAKLLYDYWFIQFDFPDENGKPYKSSGGKMVWNEDLKREIPEGWEVKHASDLTKVKTGKEDANFATENGKYAYFTCGQEILRCDIPAFEGRAVLLAGNGDFNVKHYSGKFNAYQRTYVLIPENTTFYALLYIATKEAIARFTRGSAGSIVKFITLGDVQGISLLDPHNDQMLDTFNLLIDKIEQIQFENQQLASLRDFLLPMLMNGQVKVGRKGDLPPVAYPTDEIRDEYMVAAEPQKASDSVVGQ